MKVKQNTYRAIIGKPVSSCLKAQVMSSNAGYKYMQDAHPSFALLLLGIDGVAAHHPHEQVERVMEIAFTLTFVFLSAHGVWNVCQEGREQLAE